MDSFLLKVVKSIFREEHKLENYVFVLPNRRAGVYLKKYITQEIKQTSLFPEIITFDNFVEKITGIYKASSLELLIDFYKVYKNNTPSDKAESFELFSNWATTVLDDFNEIDAFLVDPKSIFLSLKEINELHNWNTNTELTQNYLAFFKKLEKYYHEFYDILVSKERGYQGLIFRQAVNSIQPFIENTNNHIVFVGFNFLKESESQIIQELLVADKASIYWDVSKNMLKDQHPAGLFIRKYKSEWNYYKNNPFNWISTNEVAENSLEIVGIPKNVGMLKYASELLNNSNTVNETTLVLADQNILPVALNSLPKKVEKVNITMGFPLQSFPFSNLIDSIFQLHISANTQSNQRYYYKSVLRVLQHPTILTHIEKADDLVELLLKKNSVYYSYDTIKSTYDTLNSDIDNVLNLFKPIEKDNINELLERFKSLIAFLRTKLDGIEKEVLYRHHQLIQQLLLLNRKNQELLHLPKGQESIKSFYNIYKRLLLSENFNFIGEPLQGLQIMGFLETQALHFKQLIITSLNEGILPKGKGNNSFIPFDVRKHYGLPTYKEEDAMTSYHFYRLLESADKVSLLYNNQTDTFGGGEKSQFLTQLLWQYPNIKQSIVNPNTRNENNVLQSIAKTPAIIEKLKNIAITGFSPSALATYIYNPITFYQERILDIKDLDEIEETVADNTMGTVIHNTLEKLYQPLIDQFLSEEALQKLLPIIPDQVKIEFKKAYKNGQYKHGKNKLIYEVILNFVKRFIKEEIKEVKSGKAIRIIALEKKLETQIDFPKFKFPIKIKGYVDRIDEVDGVLRILDFKSGKVIDSQLRMGDFSKILLDYKFSKALQVLLYAYLYTQQKDYDSSKELQAGIVSFKNLNAGFMPVNFAAPFTKPDYRITKAQLQDFLATVENLLLEIFDPSIPFMERE